MSCNVLTVSLAIATYCNYNSVLPGIYIIDWKCMTRRSTENPLSYSEKFPTMSTPSITKSSTRMDEDYDCTSESIGVRSITTKKTTLKIAEPDSFNGNLANFRRFKRQYGLYLCANKETYPGD